MSIPSTSFRRDGNTVLWVPAECTDDRACAMMPDNPCTTHARWLNRPCDTCGGSGIGLVDHGYLPDCSRCDGTGCLTFDISVAWDRCLGFENGMDCGGTNCRWNHESELRTLTVHVIDVLPIVGRKECRDVPAHVCIASDGETLRHAELVNNGSETEWPITLPPDAARLLAEGKKPHVVRLAVHS